MPTNDTLRPSETIEVATLLGSRGLDLSIRCLMSFVACTGGTVSLRVHEDGSLTEANLAKLSSSLPISGVIRRTQSDRLAEDRLRYFPACAALRKENVLALKLFDCIFFESQATLRYVDSDVLFVRPFSGAPILPEPDAATFFPDDQSAYSLRSLQLFRAGAPTLPARLNTGLFSFPVRRFQLDAIERFLQSWTGRTPAWIEQSCWAITAGVAGTRLLSRKQFQIYRPGRLFSDEVIALHFVSSVRSHLQDFVGGTGPFESGEYAVSETTVARRLTPLRLALEELNRAARRPAWRPL